MDHLPISALGGELEHIGLLEVKAPEVRMKTPDIGKGHSVKVRVLLQKLGLADAAIFKDHRQDDIIRQGSGHLTGEGLVFRRGKGAEGFNVPLVGHLDIGQGIRRKGLGHHPEGEGDKAVFHVCCGDGGLPVGNQSVLGFQNVLHPGGDALDLAFYIPLHIAYLVGQVLVLPVHILQLAIELPGSKQDRQHQKRPKHRVLLFRCFLGEGADVAGYDLLHHL